MKYRHYGSRVLTLAAALSFAMAGWAQSARSGVLSVNYRNLVSRADLDYDQPASRSEEGIPIGNGRMGSLVWTTPSALHFQINRVEVFAENSYTASIPRADTNFASDCGYGC